MKIKKLPGQFYKKIIDTMPLLCIDVVIVHQGKFLLVKRTKQPLKGKWWIPGGRVFKGETLETTVKRKIKEELNINIQIIKPLGYYEDFFKDNDFGLRSGLHTLSLVFQATPLSLDIKLDKQSASLRWSKKLPKRFKIKPFNCLLPDAKSPGFKPK